MSEWWNSKRLLVLLVGLIGTSSFAGWSVAPDTYSIMMLCAVYIGGQSLVDAAKAWRAK